MFWFKSCPKCTGDLCEKEDLHGKYISCMQCGITLTVSEEAIVRQGRIPDPATEVILE